MRIYIQSVHGRTLIMDLAKEKKKKTLFVSSLLYVHIIYTYTVHIRCSLSDHTYVVHRGTQCIYKYSRFTIFYHRSCGICSFYSHRRFFPHYFSPSILFFRTTCNMCPITLQPFSKSRYSLNLPFSHYCLLVYILKCFPTFG